MVTSEIREYFHTHFVQYYEYTMSIQLVYHLITY